MLLSLINRGMLKKGGVRFPEVGDGGTELLPTSRRVYTVIRISKDLLGSGTVVVREDTATRIDGGGADSERQVYSYTVNPDGRIEYVDYIDGRWIGRDTGSPFVFGMREKWVDTEVGDES